MQQISITELLGAALGGPREAAREWTEKEWQEALLRSSLGMAQEILHHVPDLPRLLSVTGATEGTSAFIVMESDNAEFTIVVNTTRKTAKSLEDNDSDKCVFCGKVHENATTKAMVDYAEKTDADNPANRDRVTADEPVKPWPAWGSNASD